MWFRSRNNQCQDRLLTYHCIRTGVHVVPLQVMFGQVMLSSGACVYCGRQISANTIKASLVSSVPANLADTPLYGSG